MDNITHSKLCSSIVIHSGEDRKMNMRKTVLLKMHSNFAHMSSGPPEHLG